MMVVMVVAAAMLVGNAVRCWMCSVGDTWAEKNAKCSPLSGITGYDLCVIREAGDNSVCWAVIASVILVL
jgi:hypothetical protein